jgi:hypothetical protein
LQCSLQLRWCGNCHGVAGPFDRFCGFCGFELIRGGRRNPLWRLRALVALVPLVVGLGYGLYVARAPAAVTGVVHGVLQPTRAQPAAVADYASRPLGLHYSGPPNWTVVDYTAGEHPQPTVVLSRDAVDQSAATAAAGDLAQVDQPQASLIAISRPPTDGTLVADTRDPVAALTSELAPVVAAPPPGVRVAVVRPVRAVTVGGRQAAEAVLRLDRGDAVAYLRRDLVYAPYGAVPALCRVDALVPAAEWPAADTSAVSTVLGSLRFG